MYLLCSFVLYSTVCHMLYCTLQFATKVCFSLHFSHLYSCTGLKCNIFSKSLPLGLFSVFAWTGPFLWCSVLEITFLYCNSILPSIFSSPPQQLYLTKILVLFCSVQYLTAFCTSQSVPHCFLYITFVPHCFLYITICTSLLSVPNICTSLPEQRFATGAVEVFSHRPLTMDKGCGTYKHRCKHSVFAVSVNI